LTSSISAATIASNGSNTTTTALTVLAQAAADSTQTANTEELAEIDNLIQNRLNTEIAALQPPADSAITTALGNQISSLQAEQSSTQKLGAEWGNNSNILESVQTQLAQLQTYAAAGDATDFDTTLAAANVDVSDLTVVNAPAPYQPDGVEGLKGNGLGIGNAASYDLSTEAGQQAAAAAINAAQSLVGQIAATTTSNHLLAGDLTTSISTQLNTLISLQQQAENSSTTATQNQIAALTEDAQNQEHLIELSLGSTQTIASMVSNVENPPQPITSVFEALQDAVGATPATYSSTQSTPAILSLLT
jgi:hypothetical protein